MEFSKRTAIFEELFNFWYWNTLKKVMHNGK